MPALPSAAALVLALRLGAPSGAGEDVPELLRRQTQELVDAISSGAAAVWDR